MIAKKKSAPPTKHKCTQTTKDTLIVIGIKVNVKEDKKMKATGIVRKIDNLGRITIPKETRRTLRIKEGDPMEIYTEADAIVLKRYNPIVDLQGDIKRLISSVDDEGTINNRQSTLIVDHLWSILTILEAED